MILVFKSMFPFNPFIAHTPFLGVIDGVFQDEVLYVIILRWPENGDVVIESLRTGEDCC